MLLLKMLTTGFLWCSVMKNPPANAGDTGSSPAPERFQISLCATTIKPVLYSQEAKTTGYMCHNY